MSDWWKSMLKRFNGDEVALRAWLSARGRAGGQKSRGGGLAHLKATGQTDKLKEIAKRGGRARHDTNRKRRTAKPSSVSGYDGTALFQGTERDLHQKLESEAPEPDDGSQSRDS